MTAARLPYPDRLRAYAAAGMPATLTLSPADLRDIAAALDAGGRVELALARIRAAELDIAAARPRSRWREAAADRACALMLYFAALVSAGNAAAVIGELFRWAP